MTKVNREFEAMLPNRHEHQSRVRDHAAAVPGAAKILDEHGVDGTSSLFEQADAICSLALLGEIRPAVDAQTPTEPPAEK